MGVSYREQNQEERACFKTAQMNRGVTRASDPTPAANRGHQELTTYVLRAGVRHFVPATRVFRLEGLCTSPKSDFEQKEKVKPGGTEPWHMQIVKIFTVIKK